MDFWTIEVLDAGTFSGSSWRELDGGVVFAVECADESDGLCFRGIAAVRPALDPESGVAGLATV